MPTQANSNPTLEAFEVGVLISTFLLGASTVQTYVYFHKFPRDTWTLKTLVWVIWIIDVGQSICVCHTFYIWTIVSIGDLGLKEPITLSISILLFMAPMVQSFFAYRIRRFSDSYYVATFCWALSLLRIVGAIWLFTVLRKSPSTEYFYKYYSWLVTMVYATGALVDVVIAVSMCWYLARMRKLSVKETKSSINHLVTWCIQTGLLTSIGSIATLVTFTLMPNNLIWLGIYAFLDKLYSNSLLAMLNARAPRYKCPDNIVDFSEAEFDPSSNKQSRPKSICALPRFAPCVISYEIDAIKSQELGGEEPQIEGGSTGESYELTNISFDH